MMPDEVAGQLRMLGVREGGVLLVHTSFRAARPVEGGPLGLIAALRDAVGEAGTVVMPTMTDGASPFDPARTPTCDMGITAELFWRQRGVVRSDHPGASFAAAGRRAKEICAPQPLSPPHGPDSPVGRAHARLADSKDVVEMAVRRLRADPTVFLCPATERCGECDLARASMCHA